MRWIAFALAALLSLATIAHAQDASAYDSVIEAALAEFGAGRWEEARALFRRAHELQPNARTLRGIGMASFELRDYPEALAALEAALVDERRPLTEEQRTQVTQLVERARAFVGTYEVPAAPEDARLFVDGARVSLDGWPAAAATLRLGLGEHDVELRAGDRTTGVHVTVRGNERTALEVDVGALVASPEPAAEPEPAPERDPVSAPPPPDPAPFVAMGVGLGVAAVGGVLVALGWVDIGAVQTGGRNWADLEPAYERAPILTGLGGAILGAGLGTTLIGVILASLPPSAPRSRSSVAGISLTSVSLTPGGLALEGTF